MSWVEVRDALLAMAPVAPSELATVSQTGVYAWWDLSGAITWPVEFPKVDISQPLYVGLAEKNGLDERGIKMHLKTTRMSGLRRNLLSLLHDELALFPGMTAHPERKMSLAKQYEAELSRWMLKQLTVTWVVHPVPGLVERDIIDDLLPPLNSDFAHRGEYWIHIDRLRGQVHAAAMAAGQVRGF